VRIWRRVAITIQSHKRRMETCRRIPCAMVRTGVRCGSMSALSPVIGAFNGAAVVWGATMTLPMEYSYGVDQGAVWFCICPSWYHHGSLFRAGSLPASGLHYAGVRMGVYRSCV